MKFKFQLIIAFVIMFFFAGVINAQWVQTGGPNVTVTSLATYDNYIFAGTVNGVYVSTDNGANWSQSGLLNNFIQCLTVVPNGLGGNNIYAGGNGVFLSTDNGANWTQLGLNNVGVMSLTIRGNNIFAGGEGAVYLSTDAGISWARQNNGLTPFEVISLATDGTNVFAGTLSTYGVYLSTDSGSNWTQEKNGLTNDTVNSLLIKEGKIFAGTSGGGVCVSTNNGSNWSAVNNGLTDNNINSIVSDGTCLYTGSMNGGIFLSTDMGTSWSSFNDSLTNLVVQCIAVSNNNIYESNYAGIVWKYPLPVETNKSTLSFLNVSLNVSSEQSIIISDSSNSDLILDSIFTKSKEFVVNVSHGSIASKKSLTINITFTPDSLGNFTDTLFVHNNSFQSLKAIPLFGNSPYSVAILDKDKISFLNSKLGTVYKDSIKITDASLNQLIIDSIYTLTKYFSVNTVKDTCSQNNYFYVSLTFNSDTTRLYADTLYIQNNTKVPLIKIPLIGNVPAPLLKVNNDIINLPQTSVSDSSSIDIPLYNTSVNTLNVLSLTNKKNKIFKISTLTTFNISGNDSAKIHITFYPTSIGLFIDTIAIYTNGGSAWLQIYGTSPSPGISFSNQSLVFRCKVMQKQTETLKVSNTSINALSIYSISTNTKYYTYSTINFPDTIKAADTSTISITFSPDSAGEFVDTLLFITNSFETQAKVILDGVGDNILGVALAGNKIPDSYKSYQNYPNPFNPSTIIKYALPYSSNVKIEVYNILGEKIKELVNGQKPAGYYDLSFNTTGLASGIYFYMIEAKSIDGKNEFRDTKKMILLK